MIVKLQMLRIYSGKIIKKGFDIVKSHKDYEFRTVRGYQLINRQQNQLTSAMEDYLEMACRLCVQEGYTRIGRLSESLHVRPSSASKMVSRLVNQGFLAYDHYESIRLTDQGKRVGEYLIERHNTVEQFLKLIGNSNPLEETELIEHTLNPDTVYRLKTLLEFFQWDKMALKHFHDFQEIRGVGEGEPASCPSAPGG